MKQILLGFTILLMSFTADHDPNFKDQQLDYYTVFQAYRDKAEDAYAKLRAQNINRFNCDIFIRAFKFEEDLEVWAKNKNESKYRLITTYKFCDNVGQLGPKRKEGDMQIPEGFYSLSKFNPSSNYFLSLQVDYPNASDLVFADRQNPGGMIFIHGGCSTVGCIPITDEWIKELYVLCVEAKTRDQENIPIHIFPARLTDTNFTMLRKQFSDTDLHDFWSQLKKGYDLFEHNKTLAPYRISAQGEYIFQ
ncbi:MAG: hypothetical protein HOI49_03065 [Bacteroidetes bacterium]|jgi:murein L,D-transpeptidase YafK|nr:hypothetical protein [Bacteroidota bacterium]